VARSAAIHTAVSDLFCRYVSVDQDVELLAWSPSPGFAAVSSHFPGGTDQSRPHRRCPKHRQRQVTVMVVRAVISLERFTEMSCSLSVPDLRQVHPDLSKIPKLFRATLTSHDRAVRVDRDVLTTSPAPDCAPSSLQLFSGEVHEDNLFRHGGEHTSRRLSSSPYSSVYRRRPVACRRIRNRNLGTISK